ncbi:MAG: DUF1189 domain-containing protein [Acidobacteriota bacterium]
MALNSISVPSFYRQAYLTITDFQFYRLIFQQPLRNTLRYLLYLTFHVAALLTVAYAWNYGPAFNQFLHWAQDNFPPLEVRDGKLSVEGQQPWVRKYLGDKIYTFVFDTTGQHQPLHKLSQPAIVFTEDNLYAVADGSTRTWPWKQLPPFKVSRQDLIELEQFFKWAYFPSAFLMLFILALATKVVQALLLTLFSLSASARYGIRLPFANYFTIALYSLTPAIVIDVLLNVMGQDVPYFEIIYMATAAIYTYLATHRCMVVE